MKRLVAHYRWNDICRPKEEGGFGIRRIQDLSQVSS